jgi:flagellar basal-body rod protein FlgB
MSGTLFDGLHHGLKQVLDLRGQQHAVTATNIAHRDTPGYRAKELDFTNALAEAVASGEELSLARTDANHMSVLGPDGSAPMIEHEPDAGDADGNSVDLEKEQARMAENLLLTNAVTDGLSRRLAILKFAASNGR